MAQANEPSEYDRQLRHMNRRLERLEDTQISPQEFARAFDRVHDDMQLIRTEIGTVNTRIDRLEAELTGKIDLILSYVTRLNKDDGDVSNI